MQNLAEIFKNTFDPFFNAPIQIWETFAESGQVIETAKNEVIKKYNEREKYFYFILKGSGGIMLFQNNNYLCIDLCYEELVPLIQSLPDKPRLQHFKLSTGLGLHQQQLQRGGGGGRTWGTPVIVAMAESLRHPTASLTSLGLIHTVAPTATVVVSSAASAAGADATAAPSAAKNSYDAIFWA